jgi:hypothetical protein
VSAQLFVTKIVFGGIQDKKPVVVIIKNNDKGTQFFAKPNKSDVDTLHFYDYSGSFSVHQDSADGSLYRTMNIAHIASGTLTSGLSFVGNSGLELAIIPTKETANGFSLDFNRSGAAVGVPLDSQPYLMALGTWNTWAHKPEKRSSVV